MEKERAAGIIIATGYNVEGEQLDPLTPLGTTTIVKRIVLTFQLAGISPIIVITGFDGLSVERHLANYGVVFFRAENEAEPDFERNILPALLYAADKQCNIAIAPVEYPLFKTASIRKIMEKTGSVRVPFYEQSYGYPFLIDSTILSKLCRKEKFQSWMPFWADNGICITPVPVEDEGIICNIKDMEHCKGILEQHDKQMMHPYVRLDIDYPTRIFDPRLKMLLLLIRDTMSVKTACQRISLSIGKAWEIINTLEEALGYEIVNRRQGGKRGGSTSLTPEGEDYLKKYCLLEQRIQDFANEEFHKIFWPEEK